MNQRWYKRLNTWRDASEIIDTRAHEVAEIFDDSTAKAFVEEHHYSGTYPAAREHFGLYRSGLWSEFLFRATSSFVAHSAQRNSHASAVVW